MKTKRVTVAVMLLIMTLTISGCGVFDFFEEIFDPTLMIIRGPRTISGAGEVLTIQSGTTVKFRDTVLGDDEGSITITSGAKLIAQGTATEPIVFETESGSGGGIIQFEADASTESVVEYCEFGYLSRINLQNSTNIQYNKFDESHIKCYLNSNSIIKYNSFNNSKINSNVGSTPSPIIRYNSFNNYSTGALSFHEGDSPNIEYNNITNCAMGAILWWTSSGEGEPPPSSNLVVNNNYIKDCNGITGVDTTGAQSYNVIYSSPSDIPIQNAGCGW